MFLQDSTGLYNLDAVAAVTPQPIRKFQTDDGKAHPNPPVLKTVAVLHLASGSSLVTDTPYDAVVAQLSPPAAAPSAKTDVAPVQESSP